MEVQEASCGRCLGVPGGANECLPSSRPWSVRTSCLCPCSAILLTMMCWHPRSQSCHSCLSCLVSLVLRLQACPGRSGKRPELRGTAWEGASESRPSAALHFATVRIRKEIGHCCPRFNSHRSGCLEHDLSVGSRACPLHTSSLRCAVRAWTRLPNFSH